MTKTLKMVFSMPASDATVTWSLADPKDGLTKTECQTCMNEIISDEFILVNGASPTAIKEMYIHTVDDVELVS